MVPIDSKEGGGTTTTFSIRRAMKVVRHACESRWNDQQLRGRRDAVGHVADVRRDRRRALGAKNPLPLQHGYVFEVPRRARFQRQADQSHGMFRP